LVYLFFLSFFNFNQEFGKLAKPINQFITGSPKNKLEALFVTDLPHWNGTVIQFSGVNAEIFYTFIKQESVSWELFSSAILGRLDLYYYLENKNVNLEKNRKGFILKIGNRKSNHYSRIYQTKQGVKFEYEMKGRFLRKYHTSLVSNDLEEF
jgi:hypothetical protein